MGEPMKPADEVAREVRKKLTAAGGDAPISFWDDTIAAALREREAQAYERANRLAGDLHGDTYRDRLTELAEEARRG